MAQCCPSLEMVKRRLEALRAPEGCAGTGQDRAVSLRAVAGVERRKVGGGALGGVKK